MADTINNQVRVHRPDEISATEISLGRQSSQPPAHRACHMAYAPAGER